MVAFAIILILLATSCVKSCTASADDARDPAASEESEFDAFVRESQKRHFTTFVSLLANGTRQPDVNVTLTESAAEIANGMSAAIRKGLADKMGASYEKMVDAALGQFKDPEYCKVQFWACDNILSFKGLRMSELFMYSQTVKDRPSFFKSFEAYLNAYSVEMPTLASLGAVQFVKDFGKTLCDIFEYNEAR